MYPYQQSYRNYPYQTYYGNPNPYQNDLIGSYSVSNQYSTTYKDPNVGTESEHTPQQGHVVHHPVSDYEYDYVKPHMGKVMTKDHHHIKHGPSEHVISGYKNPKYEKSNKKNSVITALTLLSFLFFINLLQTCLKDNMLSLNPTVMVMTARHSRISNSREANKDDLLEMDIVSGTESPSLPDKDEENLYNYQENKRELIDDKKIGNSSYKKGNKELRDLEPFYSTKDTDYIN